MDAPGIWTLRRLVYVSPVGGTSISADPIALLRGAPKRDLAVAFMRFVLSVEGQRLWNYRVGEAAVRSLSPCAAGPCDAICSRRASLRTSAIRVRIRSILARAFHFHATWTGPYFDLIRCLDQSRGPGSAS